MIAPAEILLDRPVVCPIVVGRAPHVAALGEALDHAASGRGQVILVSGEAGIGKSRLVREAETRALAAGMTILRGASFEPDRRVPYGLLLGLLRAEVLTRPPEEIAALLGPNASDLVRILPELSAQFPDAPQPTVPSTEQDQWRLTHALGEVFLRMAATRPLLLVFEDLHWSDDTSLDCLRALARRLVGAPVALLATYRSDEVQPALSHLLSALDRERLAAELRLERLTEGEVGEMVSATFELGRVAPPDFVRLIFSSTDGNPFFVEEVLRSLVGDGAIFRSNGGWTRKATADIRVPRTVQDAVWRRTEALSAGAHRVLVVAAVSGRLFDFALLTELTGMGETELLEHLRALVGAQLVVEVSADRFAFRHALTREAVRGTLLARERHALHRQVGEVIERLYADSIEPHLADLAHHFREAGDLERTLAYARRAGERALGLYAPAEATEHLSDAIDAATELGTPPPSDVVRARGQALEVLGELDRARQDYERALGLARASHDRDREWQGLIDLGCLWAGRDYEEAGRAFEAALRTARQADDPARLAKSLNRVGNWQVNVGRTAEGLEHHRAALRLFESVGDAQGCAETLDLLGMGLGIHGDPVAAIEHLDRAVDGFRTTGDLYGLVSSLTTRVAFGGPVFCEPCASPHRSLKECRRDSEEALRLSAQTGSISGRIFAEFASAQAFSSFGELGVALPHAATGVRLADEVHHQQWMAGARFALGACRLAALDTEGAVACLEEALTMARQVGSQWWIGCIAPQLALACLTGGDVNRAEAVLASTWPGDREPRNSGERRVAWMRAEVAVARRQPELALRIVADLLSAAPGGLRGQSVPWLEKIRGDALHLIGRTEDAVSALAMARNAAEENRARPLLWQVQRSLARVHQARGDVVAAHRAVAAARETIEAMAATLGESPDRERFLRSALKTLPTESEAIARRSAAQAFGGLTEREREVASHIRAGQTNREIAEALVVGERTVETHVSSILGKLALRSRREVAAWAAEHGLGSPPY